MSDYTGEIKRVFRESSANVAKAVENEYTDPKSIPHLMFQTLLGDIETAFLVISRQIEGAPATET